MGIRDKKKQRRSWGAKESRTIQHAEIQNMRKFPDPGCRVAQMSNDRWAKGKTESNRCFGMEVLRWSPVFDPRIVSPQDSLVVPC